MKASDLIEILKDHPDADVCCCKCAEELIIMERGGSFNIDLRSVERQVRDGPLS